MSSQSGHGHTGYVSAPPRDASDWTRRIVQERAHTSYSLGSKNPNPEWMKYGNDFRLMLEDGAFQCCTESTPLPPVINYFNPGSHFFDIDFSICANGCSAITDIYYSTDEGVTWRSMGMSASGTYHLTVLSADGVTAPENRTHYPVKLVAVTEAHPYPGSNNASGTVIMVAVNSARPPDAPIIEYYTPLDRELQINYKLGPSTGGSRILRILYSTDGGYNWSTPENPYSGSSSGILIVKYETDSENRLRNDHAYSVILVTITQNYQDMDANPKSNKVTMYPSATISTPSAPDITSWSPGDGFANIYFALGSNGGSQITNVYYSTNGGQNWVSNNGNLSSPLLVNFPSLGGNFGRRVEGVLGTQSGGLTNGVQYQIQLLQTTEAYPYLTNPSSDTYTITPSATVIGPDAPTIISYTPGSSQLTVYFHLNSDGGSNFTGIYYSTDGGMTWYSTGQITSPLVITNESAPPNSFLNASGQYPVQLVSVTTQFNDYTVNTPSATMYMLPGGPRPPDPPTIIGYTPGHNSLKVRFQLGDDGGGYNGSGGAGITYIFYTTDAGLTFRRVKQTTSPIYITTESNNDGASLVDGTVYQVALVSVSYNYFDPFANAVSAIVPMTPRPSINPPDPVTIFGYTPGDQTLVVNFLTYSNGGSDFSDIQYSTDGGVTWATTGTWTSGSTSITITTVSYDSMTLISNDVPYNVQLVPTTFAFPDPTKNIPSNSVPMTAITSPMPPAKPNILSITPGDQQIIVNFTLGSNGGSDVYDILYTTNGGGDWASTNNWTSGVNSITITDPGTGFPYLMNGTTYTIQIVAVTGAFPSPYSSNPSDPFDATPQADNMPPEPPTNLSYTPGDQQFTIMFNLGSNGGSQFTDIQYSTNGGANWMSSGNWTPGRESILITIDSADGMSPIVNDLPYAVQLVAVTSAFSDPMMNTPSDTIVVSAYPNVLRPDPPLIQSWEPADQQLTLTFSLGSDGGSPIVDVLYSTDAGISWTSTGTWSQGSNTLLITNESGFNGMGDPLTNGFHYSVQLVALTLSNAGSDPYANKPSSVAVMIPSATIVGPDAPTINSYIPTDRKLRVEFVLNSSGGSPITDVQYSTDNGTTWASSGRNHSPIFITTQSFDGETLLDNDTTYQVMLVSLTQEYQTPTANSPSAMVNMRPLLTPGAPNAPSILSYTPGDMSLDVSFIPGSNGGSDFTDFQYSTDGGITWASSGTWRSSATSISIYALSSDGTTPLTNGVQYAVQLVATTILFPEPTANNPSGTVIMKPISSPVMPDPPVITYWEPADGQLTVYFTLNSNGGTDVTDVVYSTDGGTTWSTTTNWTTGSNNLIITNESAEMGVGPTLTNDGIGYPVQLVAVTTGFPDPYLNTPSSTSVMTPSATVFGPDAPSNITYTPGDRSLTVYFRLGSDGGSPFTDIQYTTNGTDWLSTGQTTSPVTITTRSDNSNLSLVNNRPYPVQLVALTTAALEPTMNNASDVQQMTPNGVPVPPDPPSNISYTPGDQQLTVNFSLGGNGGSDFTDVWYSTDSGATWNSTGTWTSGSSSIIITILSSDGTTLLANGAPGYPVKIVATTAVYGNPTLNPPSGVVTMIPLAFVTGPDPPQITGNTPADQQLTVSFDLGGNGGSDFVDVQYSTDNGETWASSGTWASGLKTITILYQSFDGVTQLVNGNLYSVKLVATTFEYTDPYSNSASDMVDMTPSATINPPEAPMITDWTTPSSGTLEVSFTLGSNGGSDFTDVQYSTDDGTTWASAGQVISPITFTNLSDGSGNLVNQTTYPVRLVVLTGSFNDPNQNTPSDPVSMTPDVFISGLKYTSYRSSSGDAAPNLNHLPPTYGTTRDDSKIALFGIPEGGNTFLSYRNPDPPEAYEYVSFHMTGFYLAPVDGDYVFAIQSDDGIQINLNGISIINHGGWGGSGGATSPVTLKGGHYYPLEMLYVNGTTAFRLEILNIYIDEVNVTETYPFLDQCYHNQSPLLLSAIASSSDGGTTYIQNGNRTVFSDRFLTIPSGKELQTNGHILQIEGQLTVSGILTNQPGGIISSYGGNITITTDGTLYNGPSSNLQNNDGTLFTNDGTLFNDNSTMTTDFSSSFYNNGTIYNFGDNASITVNTPYNTSGTLNNADGMGQCGTSALDGDFPLTATGNDCPPP